MTPEEWQRLNRLFQSAIARPLSERAAFLENACGRSDALREQVAALLAAHEAAGSFIERPAVEVEARLMGTGVGPTAGQPIGHYRIVSQLGAGGMGEVYLAQDTQLARQVALKLLPAEFTQEAHRIQRFQQEARAVSALNHPNILTIYEIGKHETTYFIATEFIDGVTLREKISKEATTLGHAVDIASQVALALTVAHEAKIVHRDIKPENIMIRADGLVKVLDFGLAKLALDPAATSGSEAATLVKRTETEPGKVLGTVAYMSPEQARGLKVDARTDIWSLGCVLFEMTTGQQPFRGATKMDVVSAILNRDPERIANYFPEAPRGLEHLIDKALRKDANDRYQTVKDLLIDLKNLRSDLESQRQAERSPTSEKFALSSAGPVSPPAETIPLDTRAPNTHAVSSAEYLITEIKQHKRGFAVALTIVVLLVVAAIGWWSMRQPKQLGAPTLSQLTTDTGLTIDPALSRDGKLLAYASDRSGAGNLDIWVRQVGGGEPMRLTQDPANEREPAFSPDGTRIVFRSAKDGGGIYVVSTLGGSAPRKIAPDGMRPRFSPDGSQIAYWTGGIGGGAGFSIRDACRMFVVASSGDALRQVRPDFLGAAYPEWTPDGHHLLFLGNRDEKLTAEQSIDWWVTPLDQGPPVATGALKVTRDAQLGGPFQVYPWALITPVWETTSNALVFTARSGDSNNLWRIGISPQTWKARGVPERLTFSPTIEEAPTVAGAGAVVTVAFANVAENTDVWSLPLDADAGRFAGELHQLTKDSSADIHARLSADGRKMVWVSARSGGQQVWIEDLETGRDWVLTASRGEKYSPAFSPDGTQVSFSVIQDNKWNVFVIPTAGGVPEPLCEECGQVTGWSPDGRYVTGNGVDGRVYIVEVASRRRVDLVALSPRWFCCPEFWFLANRQWISFSGGGRTFTAPFNGETPPPESSWISWDTNEAHLSPAGTLVYGSYQHDGFTCIGARRLDQATMQPTGPWLAVFHSHAVRTSVDGFSVARGRMLLDLAEHTANIWMAQWKQGW